MMGRRSAALLCVLLSHALIVFLWMRARGPADQVVYRDPFDPLPIYIPEDAVTEPEPDEERELVPTLERPRMVLPALPEVAEADTSPEAPPGPDTLPQEVDWPIEGKRAVKRVLDAEEEAERIARRFSGAKGTWASLTPRDRSAVKKFRWKQGVVPERDENGNTIVHISEGCVVVNFSFIGCALGKKPVYGDLFKDMRLYFDEQRRPESKNGNGR
jgi:hypothetical protein